MRISDWSSDVCSSDLSRLVTWDEEEYIFEYDPSLVTDEEKAAALAKATNWILSRHEDVVAEGARAKVYKRLSDTERARTRSEEHTSELQSLMRNSYAVFCLKKKKSKKTRETLK